METERMRHDHTWTLYCTDVQAQSATVVCRCGQVEDLHGLSSQELQAALEGREP